MEGGFSVGFFGGNFGRRNFGAVFDEKVRLVRCFDSYRAQEDDAKGDGVTEDGVNGERGNAEAKLTN